MRKREKQIIIGLLILAAVLWLGMRAIEDAPDHDPDADYEVVIYHGHDEYARFPFGVDEVVKVEHAGRSNVIHLRAESVYMHEANCHNHDCLHQDPLTLENLTTRILGEWIICLPNRVSIEVVGGDQTWIHEN